MTLVSILVPEELVLDVYRLIGGTPASSGGPPSQGWSPEQIRRAFAESPPAMKAIFTVLASRPDRDLVIEDFEGPVSKAVGKKYGHRQLMGALGAFGRRCKNRYRKPWPFEAPWNDARKQVLYRMSRDVAKVITEAAKN